MVVLVSVEQLEGVGGLGKDADGFGAALYRVLVAWWARMAAIRSMVALNLMASPAAARAMIIPGGIQLNQIIFEHVFNIKAQGRHRSGNAARHHQRTTPHQSGHHLGG